ncbi:hypothetical protein A1507_18805 [Methylomonas koyamae]|uniref:Uncharacterized protein n=1 Tax=Methylomonas koyamae TaxID=702114 RepID=A0A177N461_9GAMM|nr:hypothetical protein [Methylomonas koyamae]OAI12635.1 hypothetical protein A1507_18805 [Methylomonas koyamae]
MSLNEKPLVTRPNLTIVKNINVGDVNMNVKAEGNVTVKIKKPKADMPSIDNPLTPGHRAELKDLIDKWVNLSGYLKKPLTFSAAWSMLNRQAKSMGKVGVTTINHYPDCDFERGKKFIQQEIAKLNKKPTVKKNSPTWRNSQISAIQTRCKQMNIADEKRRGYMESRFGVGKNSLTKLTDTELQEFKDYVMNGSPKFDYKQPQAPMQQIREKALSSLIDEMEKAAIDSGEYFNRESIPFKRETMLDKLQARDPGLFGDLAIASFKAFWNKQQICKLASGKPRGEWQN